MMTPADFGEVQTIISFLTQIGIFLQVLGLVSISIINKYPDRKQRDALIAELSRLSLFLSLVVLIVTIFAAPVLQSFFSFNSAAPFYALGASLLISVPAAFANSYLQAHKRFVTLSQSQFIATIGKLVFGVSFVLLGWATFGAIFGLILASALSLVFALKKGQGIGHFVESNLHLRKPKLHLIRPELPYAAMVFCTSLTINLMLSLDILVVKHYFDPHTAGLYTGISIISNIIYFVTGPFVGVMIPSLKLSNSRAQNRRYLLRSVALTFSIGGIALAVFALAPTFVVTTLLGGAYATYAHYLPKLALTLFILSVSNIAIYYHVALRHYMIAPIVLIGLGVTFWLLSNSHADMGQVVNGLLGGAIVLIALVAGLTIKSFLPERSA